MRRNIKEWISVGMIILLLPYIATVFIGGKEAVSGKESFVKYVEVRVGNQIRKVPWEEFFIGILAKEMPPDFEEEALRAQAILIRTNLAAKKAEEGEPVFTDAYLTDADRKKLWGKKKAEAYDKKWKKAMQSTKDKVMFYQEKPCRAPFHFLSNGKTRSGAEAFGTDAYPYLQSRDCPKDVEAKEQLTTISMSYEEAKEKVRPILAAAEEKEAAKGAFTAEDFEVKETDSAGYVTKIRVAHDECAGEAFREALDLPSGCFTLQGQEETLRIAVNGVGHGLGMSQYTAQEMAKEGKTAEEILGFFFEGVEIKEAESF